MAEWDRFPGDKFHVLGNQDMDRCDEATIMKLWGMPAPYYSFDRGGFPFVVLDRNHFRQGKGIVPYAHGNWGHAASSADLNCLDEPQLAWLADDLRRADRPTVVFVHQPLVATNFPEQIGNGKDLLHAFDVANHEARRRTGQPRVVAVFLGHDHDDLCGERNGVHHVLLNSASYAYTSADGACFYRDPLFAWLTFDPAGVISVEGRSTVYGPKPAPERVQMQFQPRISSRSVAWAAVGRQA